MKPLGHRILIKPDEQPTESDAGIQLLEDDYHVPTTGVVVAVGPRGDRSSFDIRARAIGECLDVLDSFSSEYSTQRALVAARKEIVRRLANTPDPVREVHKGDRVAFSIEAGMDVWEDGVRYVLLYEDDAVLLLEEAAA